MARILCDDRVDLFISYRRLGKRGSLMDNDGQFRQIVAIGNMTDRYPRLGTHDVDGDDILLVVKSSGNDSFRALLIAMSFKRRQSRQVWKLRVQDVIESESALNTIERLHCLRDHHNLSGHSVQETAQNSAGCGAGCEIVNAYKIKIVPVSLAGQKLYYLDSPRTQ